MDYWNFNESLYLFKYEPLLICDLPAMATHSSNYRQGTISMLLLTFTGKISISFFEESIKLSNFADDVKLRKMFKTLRISMKNITILYYYRK